MNFHERELIERKFCVQPHATGLGGGTVLSLVPRGCSHSYLMLEVVKGKSLGQRFRVARYLVKQFQPDPWPDAQARYQGTLILRSACCLTEDGFLEPTGERREV